jgi:hypothetical protein
VKREHTTWGAPKIRERLIRRSSGIKIPAKSTIHAVLDRHGLVERRVARGVVLMKCPAEVYQPATRTYKGLPDIDYPFHDQVIVVTLADASVWGTKKSISARYLPARRSASKKFTTISGWLVLWIVIWGTSISILECSNRSTTRSARGCYLCSRYIL